MAYVVVLDATDCENLANVVGPGDSWYYELMEAARDLRGEVDGDYRERAR